MYPNLYFAVKDLFNIELPFLKMIQSFGFFVAIAFLLASYLFAKELKRKEKEGFLKAIKTKAPKAKKASSGDYFTSAIIGFLLGYKFFYIVSNYSSFLENVQGFILSSKGSAIGGIVTALVFIYLKHKEDKKNEKEGLFIITDITEHPYELVGNMTLIAAFSGIIGAKIFHNLENIDEFLADPIGSLISFSGLTMYGGLICGSFAVVYYAVKKGINYKHLIDACAPGLMLAYGVGRIGCQVAGDGDWGIDNLAAKPNWMSFLPDWMWSYSYPHNVNEVGIPIPGCMDAKYCYMLENPVFPTPFYETIVCLLLFSVLWLIRKRIHIPGVLFCIYLIFNGVERFFIEKIRVNTLYNLFGKGITQAEIISTLLFFMGILGVWYFNKTHSKTKNAV